MSELFTYVGGTNQEDVPPPGTARLIIDRSAVSLCYYLCNLCNNTLQQVIFPSNGILKQVEASAFSNCHALRTIAIPCTVETIGEKAFYQCLSLADVTLSKGLKTIGKEAFYGCSSLQSVGFPSTVNTIGTRAFYECRSLEAVTFCPKEDSITDLRKKEVYICKEAFARCSSLARIKYPNTGYLKEGIFSECKSLRHVELPEGLRRIEEKAFDHCTSLVSIAIPTTVTYVEIHAFRGCVSLVSVELYPGYSLHLDSAVFMDCKSLVNIWTRGLSRDCSSGPFYEYAFDGCDLLGEYQGALIRFDDLPVHGQCYEAPLSKAKHLRMNIALTRTNSILEDHLTDKYGMTPFHVLLSAAKPRTDLLEVLLEEYPPHLLGWKDVLGNRPLDYLICNYWTENSKQSMELALQKWMVDWVTTWGLESWQRDMKRYVKMVLACDVTNEYRRQNLFNLAHDRLSVYERMEMTSLLELWLWKMEMDSAGQVDRLNARNRCGAPFVIPNVFEFVGRTAASSSRTSR